VEYFYQLAFLMIDKSKSKVKGLILSVAEGQHAIISLQGLKSPVHFRFQSSLGDMWLSKPPNPAYTNAKAA